LDSLLTKTGTIFARAGSAVCCQKCEVVFEVEFGISAAALRGSLVRWGFTLDDLTMRSGTEQGAKKKIAQDFLHIVDSKRDNVAAKLLEYQ